jgi:hypothetical protein
MSIRDLPNDVLTEIAKLHVKPVYKLRDWIQYDKLDWYGLSSNPHPCAIDMLEKNVENVNWHRLSPNPSAISLIENHLDKVNWQYLSRNENAIPIIQRYLHNADWTFLSCNPNAMSILESNRDKIDWITFSANPNIFDIDSKATQDAYRDFVNIYHN